MNQGKILLIELRAMLEYLIIKDLLGPCGGEKEVLNEYNKMLTQTE